MTAKLHVRVLDPESEIDTVAEFLKGEISVHESSQWTVEEHARHLRWLLLENPERGDYPSGWGLYSGKGELVGVHLNVPKLCSGKGGIVPFFTSCYYYVEEQARGMESLGLFLTYRKLASQGVLLSTSANANSAPFWERLGGKAIPGTDREWIRPSRYVALAEQFLHDRTGWRIELPTLDRGKPLSDCPTDGPIRWLRSREEVESSALPPSEGKLEAVRSPEWLTWKYTGYGATERRLYRFDGERAPIFIGVALSSRGYRQQIRALRLLDAWSTGSMDLAPVFKALEQAHLRDVDIITIRGKGALPKTAEALGWRRRDLDVSMYCWAPGTSNPLDTLGDMYPDFGA